MGELYFDYFNDDRELITDSELIERFESAGIMTIPAESVRYDALLDQEFELSRIIEFCKKNECKYVLYKYECVCDNEYLINERILSMANIEESRLSAEQLKKINEYNDRVIRECAEKDNAKLTIVIPEKYSMALVVEENIYFPGYELYRILNPDAEEIYDAADFADDSFLRLFFWQKRQEDAARIKANKSNLLEELTNTIINDESFKKCTNAIARRSYIEKLCVDNPTYNEAFINDYINLHPSVTEKVNFIEFVWKKLKN